MEKTQNMDDLLKRINELANKSKVQELSVVEKVEQDELRAKYIKAYRASLRGILENTYVQYPDGRKEKLKKKDK